MDVLFALCHIMPNYLSKVESAECFCGKRVYLSFQRSSRGIFLLFNIILVLLLLLVFKIIDSENACRPSIGSRRTPETSGQSDRTEICTVNIRQRISLSVEDDRPYLVEICATLFQF